MCHQPKGKAYLFTPQEIKQYAKDLHQSALAGGEAPFSGPVRVDVHAYFGSCRRKDIQNTLKTLCDSLQEASYDDDTQIVELHAYKWLDREDPRIEICIEELPDDPRYPLTSCQK